MENASKALMIAGGVLIAILLLTLFSYLFSRMAEGTAGIYDNLEKHEIDEFNQQFLNYEGRGTRKVGTKTDENGNQVDDYNPLVAQDIATLINLVQDAGKNSKFVAKIKIKINNNYINIDNQTSKNWLKNNANNKYKCTVVHINQDTLLVDEIIILSM